MSLSKVTAAKMHKRMYYGRQSLKEKQHSKREHQVNIRGNQKRPLEVKRNRKILINADLYER